MRQRKIKNRAKEVHLEDIFLDKAIKEGGNITELSERKLEVPLRKVNFLILLLLGIVALGTLLLSAFNLQVRHREVYEVLAQQNKFIIAYLTSERGIIYDRNKKQLVQNEATFALWGERAKILENGEKNEILKALAEITGENIEDLKTKIASCAEDNVLLADTLGHQALILFETQKENFPGFYVKKRILRHYENLPSLSHILGYLGKISAREFNEIVGYEIGDYLGKEGIEKFYEKVLREKKGEIQIERTAQGKEISREIVATAQSGDSLMLTLDFALQEKIEESLGKVLQEVNSEKGAVVALNPNNGEVFASVSLPFFDNNLFSRGISFEDLEALNNDPREPQLNRVIAGNYLTGSTIKPLIATSALEEKVITEATEIYCPLELCIPHKYTQEPACFSDWQFHGWTDIKRAIAESVNPFFYIIGGGYTAPPSSSELFEARLPKNFDGLGVERIAKYLQFFGLGTETGIDLPGEVEGRVPTPDWKKDYFTTPEAQKWYLGDTYNLSIGQGYLLATPLQMAVAFSALVNGGKILQPRLAKAILDTQNNEKEIFVTKVLRENFISANVLEIVLAGLRQAVSSPAGSAYMLNFLPVTVGAKTGTAQIYPQKEIYHNWVAAFAPYKNPEIVLVVLIEEVVGTRIAAQRVAKEVLEWYFTR